MTMVGSGLTIFAFSYLPAVIVGATSGLNADRTLFVPLAGPWIDFAQRPGCTPAGQCNTENTDRVLLAIDGVFQGIGALTTVGAFLDHQTRGTALDSSRLRVVPAQVGSSGYGLIALASF